MHLKIAERQNGEVTIVELEGRLVLGEESAALNDCVKKLLSSNRMKIIIQLTKIIRIDSAGWGSIMGSLLSARTAGGDVRLLQPSKQVKDLVEMLGLALRPDLLRIFLDEQEAVDSFQASGR